MYTYACMYVCVSVSDISVYCAVFCFWNSARSKVCCTVLGPRSVCCGGVPRSVHNPPQHLRCCSGVSRHPTQSVYVVYEGQEQGDRHCRRPHALICVVHCFCPYQNRPRIGIDSLDDKGACPGAILVHFRLYF